MKPLSLVHLINKCRANICHPMSSSRHLRISDMMDKHRLHPNRSKTVQLLRKVLKEVYCILSMNKMRKTSTSVHLN